MWPNSRETFKLLIFQYFLYQASFLAFLRNHQVNSSKCQSNVGQMSENPCLDHLTDSNFRRATRVFVLQI